MSADAEENLYKGVVVFLIVSLKNSITCVVKARSETWKRGYWPSEEIEKSITNLKDSFTGMSRCFGWLWIKRFWYSSLNWNNRNNLLNRTKFVFPQYHFDLLYGAFDISSSYISWKKFYDIYELDEKLHENLCKAAKLTYRTTQPGNNKQHLPLALAVFNEAATNTIKSYYPNTLEAAKHLNLS